MATTYKVDSWGPSLTPETTGSSAHGSSPPGPSFAPPAPSPTSVYLRPLAEDPIYTAALEQALKTSTLGNTIPLHQLLLQHRQPAGTAPPPPSNPQPVAEVAGAAAAAAAVLKQPVAGVGSVRAPGGTTAVPPLMASTAAGTNAAGTRGSGISASLGAMHGSTAAVVAVPCPPPPPPARLAGKAGPSRTSAGAGGTISSAPSGPPPAGSATVAAAKSSAAQATVTASKPTAPSRAHAAGPASTPGLATLASATPPSAAKAPKPGHQTAAPAEDLATSGQLQRGLKTGTLLRGKMRVNAGDPRDAYVTVPGLPNDIMIRGTDLQGHAVEGDEVALALLPLPQWWTSNSAAADGNGAKGKNGSNGAKSNGAKGGGEGAAALLASQGGPSGPEPWLKCGGGPEGVKAEVCRLLGLQPGMRATARVVAVLQPGARREQVVGVLQGGSDDQLLLQPLDPRLPRCRVSPTSAKSLPEEVLREARGENMETRTLMSARIVGWPSDSALPIAELRCSLGQSGELEPETAAILEMEGVRSEEFGPEVLACLPKTPWSIKPEDEKGRKDFRPLRIFSIDPPTAKDLDDALSIERLPNGNFRVGVHIADVASFIPPYSALDIEAGLRATSVYLVQRVVPMLPRLLCEELCSLNPGVERFAFSVVWELNPQGIIQTQWAGRSIIRSCAKLTYPMVQQMIEGDFKPEAHAAGTTIHGGWTWDEVCADCLALASIARHLRAARFEGGALRLDGLKLCYRLDKDGNPVSCSQYVQREANQLVEEYMLLANMSVAGIIAQAFPQLAMLRRHVPPDTKKMQELLAVAKEHNIPLDVTSAASLQLSLAAFRASCQDRDLVEVVTSLATRPMQLATYFCTGDVQDPGGWRHYALAVGQYTHFTSPIRRYPDVVVHRLLAAALEAEETGGNSETIVQRHRLLPTKLCSKVADHCNDKRLSARKAQDASLVLYLCCLLRRQPVITQAIVTQVGGDKYFSVYCPDYGIDCRLYCNTLGRPIRTWWNAAARVLLLVAATAPAPAAHAQRQASGSGFGAGAGAAAATPEAAGKLDPCSTQFCFQDWIDHLATLPQSVAAAAEGSAGAGAGAQGTSSRLQNPRGLMPALLPLQIRTLAKIPVVLYSPLRPGKISEVVARIYLSEPRVGTAAAAAGPAVPAVPAAATQPGQDKDQGSVEFQIPWESNLLD